MLHTKQDTHRYYVIDGKVEKAHFSSYLFSKCSMMIGKVYCVAEEDSRLNHLLSLN